MPRPLGIAHPITGVPTHGDSSSYART